MTQKRNKSSQPTASELAVLQLLWEHGPLAVKEVHDILEKDKHVVYTTILKTMQVMTEKGILDRKSEGRKHIYRAVITKEKTQSKLLDSFVNRAFGGSKMSLVMKALGNSSTSQNELDELKAYISQLEMDQED